MWTGPRSARQTLGACGNTRHLADDLEKGGKTQAKPTLALNERKRESEVTQSCRLFVTPRTDKPPSIYGITEMIN